MSWREGGRGTREGPLHCWSQKAAHTRWHLSKERNEVSQVCARPCTKALRPDLPGLLEAPQGSPCVWVGSGPGIGGDMEFREAVVAGIKGGLVGERTASICPGPQVSPGGRTFHAKAHRANQSSRHRRLGARGLRDF